MKTTEERLRRIEKQLGIEYFYNWDWCCDTFKKFCLAHHGTTDKAMYTERCSRKPVFIFNHMRFNCCPFCEKDFEDL